MFRIIINAIILCAVVAFFWDRFHAEQEPQPVLAPPSTQAFDHNMIAMQQDVGKLKVRVETIEKKADSFQCKTDPEVTRRLEELEAWRKRFEAADQKAAEEAKKVLTTKVDWLYNIDTAKAKAKQLGRPVLLAFSQRKELCPKCYAVRENCYKDAKIFGEISRNFVPYWAPTGWSTVSTEYGVSAFPTVVIDYGNRKESFAPSDDPVRFLAKLKEYE